MSRLSDIYNESKKQSEELNSLNSVDKIIEIESQNKFNKDNSRIILALFVAIILLTAYQIMDLVFDDSIMAYQNTTTPSLDAPVVANRLDSVSVKDVESLIRGEVRRYLRARYPKNGKEAKYLYKYVMNHSEGRTKLDFKARLQDITEISKQLDSGSVVSIYPVNSKKILIEEASSGKWNIRIPVRRVNSIGTKGDERTEPTIEMTMVYRKPSNKESSSGLYVTNYKVAYIPNSLSKKEIILEDD